MRLDDASSSRLLSLSDARTCKLVRNDTSRNDGLAILEKIEANLKRRVWSKIVSKINYIILSFESFHGLESVWFRAVI